MSLTKHKFREIVFSILYAGLQEPGHEADLSALLMSRRKVTAKNVREAQDYANKIFEKLPIIDAGIDAAAKDFYDFGRISKVELAVLRLGAYELLFDDGVPEKVALSEAIQLVLKFGTTGSEKFINAVLDNILKARHASQA